MFSVLTPIAEVTFALTLAFKSLVLGPKIPNLSPIRPKKPLRVEKNTSLGIDYMRKASDSGIEEASEFLKKQRPLSYV